jgi:hypothetical protein
MRPFRCALTVSSVTAACCLCLLTICNDRYRSECILGQISPSGSVLRATIVCFMVAAALALVAVAAFLFRPRSKNAWNRASSAASNCSILKPVWLVFMSVQRIILRAVAISNAGASSARASSCQLSQASENQFYAALFMWDVTVLVYAVSTSFCDVDEEFALNSRRYSHGTLALLLCVDAVGSYAPPAHPHTKRLTLHADTSGAMISQARFPCLSATSKSSLTIK